MSKWRQDFPALQEDGYAYLDSAATAHKPQRVINLITELTGVSYATVSRGLYKSSQDMTMRYEDARHTLAAFVNAKNNEIVFARNATEGINVVAKGVSPKRVLITAAEHHANIVPWQLTGATIDVLPLLPSGKLDLSLLKDCIREDTDVFSFTALSNVLGIVNPVQDLVSAVRAIKSDIIIMVDASQAAVHIPIDVKAWDCDFMVFTGHKLYGPTGVGVLYGKEDRLNAMPPYNGGGDMIDVVTFEHSSFRDAPHRFEAGTPNFIEAIALAEAIKYMMEIGWDDLHAHEEKIKTALFEALSEVEGVDVVGEASDRIALASFSLAGCHPQDVAMVLDQMNIAVRVGHHCAMPLLQRLGHSSLIRASAALYTNEADVTRLKEGLIKARRILI